MQWRSLTRPNKVLPGYRLTRAASDDLSDIFRRGWADFGLAQANEYHAALERAFDFLAAYPYAARLRHEIKPPVRAYPCQVHLIIYEIDASDGVIILRVRHGREDWQ